MCSPGSRVFAHAGLEATTARPPPCRKREPSFAGLCSVRPAGSRSSRRTEARTRRRRARPASSPRRSARARSRRRPRSAHRWASAGAAAATRASASARRRAASARRNAVARAWKPAPRRPAFQAISQVQPLSGQGVVGSGRGGSAVVQANLRRYHSGPRGLIGVQPREDQPFLQLELAPPRDLASARVESAAAIAAATTERSPAASPLGCAAVARNVAARRPARQRDLARPARAGASRRRDGGGSGPLRRRCCSTKAALGSMDAGAAGATGVCADCAGTGGSACGRAGRRMRRGGPVALLGTAGALDGWLAASGGGRGGGRCGGLAMWVSGARGYARAVSAACPGGPGPRRAVLRQPASGTRRAGRRH